MLLLLRCSAPLAGTWGLVNQQFLIHQSLASASSAAWKSVAERGGGYRLPSGPEARQTSFQHPVHRAPLRQWDVRMNLAPRVAWKPTFFAVMGGTKRRQFFASPFLRLFLHFAVLRAGALLAHYLQSVHQWNTQTNEAGPWEGVFLILSLARSLIALLSLDLVTASRR